MGDIQDEILRRAEAGELPGQSAPSEFALQKPQAVIKRASGQGGKPRPSEPPKQKIRDYRLVADTDPHVGEAVDTLVDYVLGSGYTITPANIVGTDENQTPEEIAELKKLVETSTFEEVLFEWLWHALVDGTSFLEIVVEDDVFKPKVLPGEKISIQTDKFGNIEEYILETDDGEIPFAPYDLAILRFHRHPGEDFGRSLIERIEEQADMLRDMEIDMARFIATKAYPPVIWKLGTDERPWTQNQIDGWLDTVSELEPESMLAVGHDVDHDIVGVTSTSSTSGAMRLEPVFHHLLRRVYTGLGLPAFLGNVTGDESKNEAVAVMPKFDRRIQRYRRALRSAIRHQVFVSILAGDSDPAEADVLPPDFEFGQHSSEEERLDADMAISLVNNGLLTFEAAAERIGVDPETELPQDDELLEHVERVNLLAGKGDQIQNPDGGAPTKTGGGSQSPGREVKTRQNPERSRDPENRDSRPQGDVSND